MPSTSHRRPISCAAVTSGRHLFPQGRREGVKSSVQGRLHLWRVDIVRHGSSHQCPVCPRMIRWSVVRRLIAPTRGRKHYSQPRRTSPRRHFGHRTGLYGLFSWSYSRSSDFVRMSFSKRSPQLLQRKRTVSVIFNSCGFSKVYPKNVSDLRRRKLFFSIISREGTISKSQG